MNRLHVYTNAEDDKMGPRRMGLRAVAVPCTRHGLRHEGQRAPRLTWNGVDPTRCGVQGVLGRPGVR